jgi:tetratricopeptide (TPR) repeat protein
MRRLIQILTAVLFAFPLCALAQNASTAFDAANRLYDQGKYAEAASSFEQLLQSKISSPALYYNLGNAFYKSGQMGRAIAAYRAAEQITPRDPDVRANLRFARNQVQGPTLASAAWQNWLRKMTLNEWTLLATGALWLLLLLLALLQWRPALNRSFRGGVIVLAAAFLFFGTCLAVVLAERSSTPAIVISRDAVVRASPFEGSPNTFTLHDGAEVRILDERKDQNEEWLKVSTDPRRIGWLRRDQVILAFTALKPL